MGKKHYEKPQVKFEGQDNRHILSLKVDYNEIRANSTKDLADKLADLEKQGVKVSAIIAVVLSISNVS